ncbi:sodium:calcium antiporter [Patescibacteria group bacterium]
MIWFYLLIFLVSCLVLFCSGSWLVESLMKIAKFLGWREFVVAFFAMALVGSGPNLFVGISSAFHKIPQLSFGDIVGGNLIDLTIIMALATLIAGGISVKSRTAQVTSIFTIAVAVLPLLLILDKTLGRGDGILLISAFFCYVFWLFSKKERFTRIYNKNKPPVVKSFRGFIKSLGKSILAIALLLLAAEGIVRSASFFAESLQIPVSLIGILVIGWGNALPEAYFAITLARKGQTWMILGDLMGSVIISATLVLGIVALLCPIEIVDFSPFAIGRFFLIISAIAFFIFVRTDRKITKKEGLFLLLIYIIFFIVEILAN